MPTTIKLKNSVTTTNAPSSLVQGEVAINVTDKKVWVGNAATTPIQLLGAGSSASFGALTCTSLTNSGLTSGRVTYAGTGGLLQDDADFTFNGTTVTMANDASISGLTVGKGGGAVATNTAVGYQAGYSNITGYQNTASGTQALYSNATGGQLVAFGWKALYASTADNNSAFGHNSQGSTTTGTSNISMGQASLSSNTTGSFNTALGSSALQLNTTASNNTAVGYQAGYSNTTGDFNTFVGSRGAGYSNTTGYQNTFVGDYAGRENTTGNRNTLIGQGAGRFITTGTKNTVLGIYDGNQGGFDIRTSSNNIVLSDGDGNPVIYVDATNGIIDGSYLSVQKTLPSTTNLNNIFKCGMYRVDSGATNTPTATFYALNVFGNGSNVTTQLATVLAGTNTYVRSYNSSWSAWVQIG